VLDGKWTTYNGKAVFKTHFYDSSITSTVTIIEVKAENAQTSTTTTTTVALSTKKRKSIEASSSEDEVTNKKTKQTAETTAEDEVRQFIEEACSQPYNEEHATPLEKLKPAYKAWCQENGIKPKMQRFSKILGQR
jgi:hypothetical protein